MQSYLVFIWFFLFIKRHFVTTSYIECNQITHMFPPRKEEYINKKKNKENPMLLTFKSWLKHTKVLKLYFVPRRRGANPGGTLRGRSQLFCRVCRNPINLRVAILSHGGGGAAWTMDPLISRLRRSRDLRGPHSPVLATHAPLYTSTRFTSFLRYITMPLPFLCTAPGTCCPSLNLCGGSWFLAVFCARVESFLFLLCIRERLWLHWEVMRRSSTRRTGVLLHPATGVAGAGEWLPLNIFLWIV